MKLKLVVMLCHQLANISQPVCVHEAIPEITVQNFLMAGKVGAEIQMPWTRQICVSNAQNIIIEWLKVTPKYVGWRPAGSDCLEDYEDPNKA